MFIDKLKSRMYNNGIRTKDNKQNKTGDEQNENF